MSELGDNNSFEQWQVDGSKDAATRGAEAAKKALETYEQPPLKPSYRRSADGLHHPQGSRNSR